MRRSIQSVLAILGGIFLMLAVPLAGKTEELPGNYYDALKYIQKQQPMEVSLETKRLTPAQLTALKEALPEGAVFHFSCTWNGISFSDESTELDLKPAKQDLGEKSLRQILSLCPKLTSVDNSTHRNPSNDAFIPLIEEYPQIHFEWVVRLRGEHYCPTNATAYSTLNHTDGGTRLKSEHMELFRYIPGIRALDVGHNAFEDLSFLRFFPDLELLIISNNDRVDDLTEVGKLSHLKYLEVHNTRVSDLSPLANCGELLDLNVCSTLVTDLSPLDEITTLERFWGNGLKKLPQEEQDRFRALHPDCACDFTKEGSAISHGWRDHDRYFHFRRCFKTKVWVPFETSAASDSDG